MKHIKLYESFSNYAMKSVYHCSDAKFDRFDIDYITNLRGSQYGKGFYFTDNLEYSKDFGSILYTCDIILNNPINLAASRVEKVKVLSKLAEGLNQERINSLLSGGNFTSAFSYICREKTTNEFIEMGYDGVIGYCEFGGFEYVVYNSENIDIISRETTI